METKFITEKIALKKVHRIHLELLSFTQKELGEKKRKINFSFSNSSRKEEEKQNLKNGKLEGKEYEKQINNVRILDNTYISSDNEEEVLENSFDVSCEEEMIL